ncbi:MAG TPA: hypothetical protein VHX60_02330 [Acidobacteriaceae bacterium]|jgi:hypothetical protein|nr:hypothetical protein [Acidobacteriaceae bacterium]
MHANTLIDREHREVSSLSIPELCDLAASGLVQMLDPEPQIFCHIFGRTEKGMRRQGLSPRYTLMTLLGLQRYALSGHRSPVAIAPVLDRLRMDTTWITGAGDLGLLLWTCAELLPAQLPQIYERVSARDALQRFTDGQQGSTMEVAWYLTGLATCCLAGYGDLPGISEQIAAARQILERNCGDSGVYGHRSRSDNFAGAVRRRIGSFADQVYPTIAFSRLAQAFDDEKARAMALRTAETMCDLQAPLGEWSWHYDAATGKVVSRYPVYSVHQHAMGPMMLFAVGEATGADFGEAIYRGLAWIGGNNELRRDFIEPSLGLIWRCIYLPPLKNYSDAALRILQLRSGAANVRMKVRYECRPYELGWLLYAFAGR